MILRYNLEYLKQPVSESITRGISLKAVMVSFEAKHAFSIALMPRTERGHHVRLSGRGQA